jgi:hypothetical protein
VDDQAAWVQVNPPPGQTFTGLTVTFGISTDGGVSYIPTDSQRIGPAGQAPTAQGDPVPNGATRAWAFPLPYNASQIQVSAPTLTSGVVQVKILSGPPSLFAGPPQQGG